MATTKVNKEIFLRYAPECKQTQSFRVQQIFCLLRWILNFAIKNKKLIFVSKIFISRSIIFSSVMLASGSLAQNRSEGFWNLTLLAGVSQLQIYFAQFITNFFIILIMVKSFLLVPHRILKSNFSFSDDRDYCADFWDEWHRNDRKLVHFYLYLIIDELERFDSRIFNFLSHGQLKSFKHHCHVFYLRSCILKWLPLARRRSILVVKIFFLSLAHNTSIKLIKKTNELWL